MITETLLVYTFLMFVMYFFTKKSACTQRAKAKLFLAIPVLAYTIIFGIRYYVGVDYPAYLEYYEYWNDNDSFSQNWKRDSFQRLEPGILIIIAVSRYLGSPIIFFSIIAFLQIYFIFKAYKDNPEILAYSMIAIVCTGMAMIHFQNGVRQYIAIPIFIYAFQFIVNKKPIQYFFWITIAVLFHKSASLLYAVYFIYAFRSTPYLKSEIIQYGLLIGSFFLAFFDFTSVITDKIDTLLTLTQYDTYSDSDYLLSNSKNVSIMMIMQFFIYLFFIAYRKQVEKFYADDKRFPLMFDLFLIATCLYFIFFRSLIIVRIFRYFTTFDFIIIGYFLNYIVQKRKQSYRHLVFYVVVCAFLFASYSAVIINSLKSTAAYVTYFQTDLHNEKEMQRDEMQQTK